MSSAGSKIGAPISEWLEPVRRSSTAIEQIAAEALERSPVIRASPTSAASAAHGVALSFLRVNLVGRQRGKGNGKTRCQFSDQMAAQEYANSPVALLLSKRTP
jgi:hypothetical protein